MKGVTNLWLLALHPIQSIPYQSFRNTDTHILIVYRFLLLHLEFHKLNLVALKVAKAERIMPWQVEHLTRSRNSMRPSR